MTRTAQQQVSSPTISVCVIVKNERHAIEPFLRSCAFADEIIMVDTGSSDGTREAVIAYSSAHPIPPIKLLEYSYEGTFHYGRARNVSLETATSDYLLVVDADERPTAAFGAGIRLFLAEQQPELATIVRQDELLPHLSEHLPRILRRTSGIRYFEDDRGRVHEQLTRRTPDAAFDEVFMHEKGVHHQLLNSERADAQLELQIERTPRTKNFVGHFLRGLWYFQYRFRKLYLGYHLYRDGIAGFKYSFLRGKEAFLIEYSAGLKSR